MMRLAAVAGILLLSSYVLAETEVIEVPEDELATETVLPVFDYREVVKNRRVNTKGRLEVGLAAGMNLTEALYNNMNISGSLGYHFTETHGANITYYSIMDGLSAMGGDLKEGRGNLQGDKFDPGLAPHPQSIWLASYQFTAYYGKISLTKQTVMNLSLYGLLGAGQVSFGDSSSVAINLGLGQKFYFTSRIALRFDLRVLSYSGPDPTSQALSNGQEVKSTDLENTTYVPIFLSLGFVFLI